MPKCAAERAYEQRAGGKQDPAERVGRAELRDQHESAYEICQPRHGGTISDSGSGLGTYVNDKRVNKFDLVDNDIVRIGNTRLQFKTVD